MLFKVGDTVEIVDRLGAVIGAQKIALRSGDLVATEDGRWWTKVGDWFDGNRAWLFPTIRIAP